MNRSERGQTLVEYGLLLALIAVVVVAVLALFGPALADLYQGLVDWLQGTPPSSPAP